MKHKHNFRKLIEDELNLNNERKKYYDGWGSRVYFFSSNLDKTCGMNCFNDSDYQKDGLKIFLSPKTALDLGIDYVFSSLMISNYLNLDLDFIDVYSSDNCNYSNNIIKLKSNCNNRIDPKSKRNCNCSSNCNCDNCNCSNNRIEPKSKRNCDCDSNCNCNCDNCNCSNNIMGSNSKSNCDSNCDSNCNYDCSNNRIKSIYNCKCNNCRMKISKLQILK